MKVSERIRRIKDFIANATLDEIGRFTAQSQLSSLEAEIVKALRVARQEGYKEGLDCGTVDDRGIIPFVD